MNRGDAMPRNKFPEETVRMILDSALELFLEKGYEQTTILDIVNNMGSLTRGAFYHHFKSKEEVLDALGDKLFYDNNLFDKAQQQSNLNGLEKIKYIITHSMDDNASRKVSVMSIKALESPTFLKRVLEDNRDIIAPQFQKLIEEGIKDGSIANQNAKLLSQLLTFLTNFWLIPTIYPCTDKEIIEKLLYVKEISGKLGIPFLDDELISETLNNAIKE